MVTKNITLSLPRSAIRKKEGVVVLPLKKWREVEELLEDYEMLHSPNLIKEIARRRKTRKTISLTQLLKKHRL